MTYRFPAFSTPVPIEGLKLRSNGSSQLMIVEKITQGDRVIVNKYSTQIKVKKVRAKDTEACQEMMRINKETF